MIDNEYLVKIQEMKSIVEIAAQQEKEEVSGNGNGRSENEDFSGIPELPDAAKESVFGEWLTLVGPTTEAADAYHFAAFSVVLGIILRKRLVVNHARRIFPNFYCSLVGPTGIGRKDTAMARSLRLLKLLHHEDINSDAPNLHIFTGVGSTEGLMDAFNGEGKTVLLHESELLGLLSKAKQDGLGNLIPKLTSFWDCPDHEHIKTRRVTVKAIDPFLSIVSGTTQAWLRKGLSMSDVKGGFANRFIYVAGRPKEPMAFPPSLDQDRFQTMVSRVNDIRLFADDLSKGSSLGVMTIPDQTKSLFELWYGPYYRRCCGDSLSSDLLVRIQSYVWRWCILYAAAEHNDQILPRHLEASLEIAKFLEASILFCFETFEDSKEREKEQKLIAYLRNQGTKMPKQKIYTALRWSVADLNNISKPLITAGILFEERYKATNGKWVQCLELINE